MKLEMRGKGIGKALLIKLAQIALAENCYGLRWQVLEWNEPALKFYETLGASIWMNGRPCGCGTGAVAAGFGGYL